LGKSLSRSLATNWPGAQRFLGQQESQDKENKAWQNLMHQKGSL